MSNNKCSNKRFYLNIFCKTFVLILDIKRFNFSIILIQLWVMTRTLKKTCKHHWQSQPIYATLVWKSIFRIISIFGWKLYRFESWTRTRLTAFSSSLHSRFWVKHEIEMSMYSWSLSIAPFSLWALLFGVAELLIDCVTETRIEPASTESTSVDGSWRTELRRYVATWRHISSPGLAYLRVA